jgi:hypothetical protein
MGKVNTMKKRKPSLFVRMFMIAFAVFIGSLAADYIRSGIFMGWGDVNTRILGAF